MLGMSPQNLHTSTCMPYYFFPLQAPLCDNLITTFSNTLTCRSKTALSNAPHFFWQGGGSWDVCVRRDFLSLSLFSPPPVFLRTMDRHITLLMSVSWRELGRGARAEFLRIRNRCNFPRNQGNNSIYINHTVYDRIQGRRGRTRLRSQESKPT